MIFFFTNRKKISLAVVCVISVVSIHAQSLLFPGDYLFEVKRQQYALTDTSIIVHTDLQPYAYKEIPTDTFKHWKYGIDAFSDKLFYENLIQVRTVDKSSKKPIKFNLDINPILNLNQGKDTDDTTQLYHTATNTRGFWIKGELGNKLSFETAFMENQAHLPAYLRNYANATGVIPGQGRWKAFRYFGYDYAMSCGILNFAVSKNFFIRVGHGKQKTGYGYRSLLLSDNSFNYPYAQFVANFFKQRLQYSQTYALLMNLTDGGSKTPPGIERIFQKKAASFQQLSWHTSKFLDLYAFQGLIAKATDSSNAMNLDPLYANPVIFSNLGAYGFNSENHILVGGGFQVRPLKRTFIYTQFMYDGVSELQGNNVAWQAGIKLFDAFTLKNLFMQFEFNQVSGGAYTNPKFSPQDYTHYGQPLTTPALFPEEFIAMISYSYKKFFLQLKQNYSSWLDNSNGNVSYSDAKLGYLINRSYNFNVALGATLRTYTDGLAGKKPQEMQIIYLSIRTSLYNLYYDF
ncbi:MAG: hypothetical protein ACXVC6_06375 [Bacteroidia bacterium]